MVWTLLIGAGVVVLAVVFAVLRVRQLNQPHGARPSAGRTAGEPPPYYTRRAGSGASDDGASGRGEEIRAAKRRIDDLQDDEHLVPVQRRVVLTSDTLPDRTRRKVERLLKQDRAASAINTIRDETGAGLDEARRIVTELRDGPPLEAGGAHTDGTDTGDLGTTPRGADAPEGGFAQHARALKAQGRTEAAVRLVVRETGMSADEAEAFVAALDAP